MFEFGKVRAFLVSIHTPFRHIYDGSLEDILVESITLYLDLVWEMSAEIQILK